MNKAVLAVHLAVFMPASCGSDWEESTEDYRIETFGIRDIPETVKLEGKNMIFQNW